MVIQHYQVAQALLAAKGRMGILLLSLLCLVLVGRVVVEVLVRPAVLAATAVLVAVVVVVAQHLQQAAQAVAAVMAQYLFGVGNGQP